ncbi:MAG: DUF1343 domain-containing protein [Holophagaceae bacterium]|nr:DUF1343 domain-containing protein [Holophagaceae bacterium]
MQFGIDRLIMEPGLRKPLSGKRIALLGHPASVTQEMIHSLDALATLPEINLTVAFGPQHGLKGEKQDNMVESQDYLDPIYKIPIFSLYGQVRRPIPSMMEHFDIILVDLQDIGCRVYTFITTLLYLLESVATHKKEIWILDRPNPIGRNVEGFLLEPGWESFVGSARLPMRHGLTVGELARWFVQSFKLDVNLTVIEMEGWEPNGSPGFGWPMLERAWVNPSPNAPNLWMARCYPGTVMLEGTTLSEGRGTTRPMELFGAPDLDSTKILKHMAELAPQWLQGCKLRPCYFEPTFHKHSGSLCNGIHIHTDIPSYKPNAFKPWRFMALVFKAIRQLYPDYELWRNFPYEYENERLAIDVINGGTRLREWVDDSNAEPNDLSAMASVDENEWICLRNVNH